MSANGKPATRRDLLHLLAQASELEHSLICQYLFTAFSLKEEPMKGSRSNSSVESSAGKARSSLLRFKRCCTLLWPAIC